jgi:hypothetical protein
MKSASGRKKCFKNVSNIRHSIVFRIVLNWFKYIHLRKL